MVLLNIEGVVENKKNYDTNKNQQKSNFKKSGEFHRIGDS